MHVQHQKIFAFCGGFAVILLMDVLTKWWAILGPMREIPLIGDFLFLSLYHKNDGIALGIDLPWWIQITASIVILLLLLKIGFDMLLKISKPAIFESLFLGMVGGGGVGNLVDRLWRGYVVDFIVLPPIPVFNVADVGITVGLTLFFATMLLSAETSK